MESINKKLDPSINIKNIERDLREAETQISTLQNMFNLIAESPPPVRDLNPWMTRLNILSGQISSFKEWQETLAIQLNDIKLSIMN